MVTGALGRGGSCCGRDVRSPQGKRLRCQIAPTQAFKSRKLSWCSSDFQMFRSVIHFECKGRKRRKKGKAISYFAVEDLLYYPAVFG